MRPAIRTVRRRYFDFVNPHTTPLSPVEIARGLANACRFAGQIIDFYSVAQHSVLVSYLVPPHMALEGLMHDASESVMHDITAPLKQLLPDYRIIEDRVERALMNQYGLNWWRPEIKRGDQIALATERRDVAEPGDDVDDDYWDSIKGIDPDPRRIYVWTQQEAFGRWLHRYHELGGPPFP